MDGFCNSGGGLDGRGRYGGRWSASPGDDLGARYFGFGGDGGGLGRGNRYGALPVRPVLK